MKLKRVMLITLLLLVVLTIGSVSAADDNSMDVSCVEIEDSSEVSLDGGAALDDGEENLGACNDVDVYEAPANDEIDAVSDVADANCTSDDMLGDEDDWDDWEDDPDDEGDDGDEFITIDGLSFYIEDMGIDEKSFYVIRVNEWPDGISPYFNISLKKDGHDAIVTSWNRDSLNIISREEYATWNIEQLQISTLGNYLVSFIFTVDGNEKVIDVGRVSICDDIIDVMTKEFSTEDLSEIFASFSRSDGTGTAVIKFGDNVLYNKTLSDFDDDKVFDDWRYDIALEEDGKFLFEDLNNGDVINIQWIDDEGYKIKDVAFFVYFENNTVRFELCPNNTYAHADIRLKYDEFSTAPEDLDEIFASVIVTEETRGNITFAVGDNVIYNKALVDFDSSRISGNKYRIALKEDEKYLFNGLNDRDIVKFAFLNEEGAKISTSNFIILRGNNTVRVHLFNRQEDSILKIGSEEFSTAKEDLGTIFASVIITDSVLKGSYYWVHITSYVYDEGENYYHEVSPILFCKSLNEFDSGRVDGNAYLIALEDLINHEDENKSIFEGLKDGDKVQLAFGDDQDYIYKEYKIFFGNSTVRFEEIPDDKINVWINEGISEDYPFFKDCSAPVVGVQGYGNSEGTLFVIVDDETKSSWTFEWDDSDKYHTWTLKDLNITEIGNYHIEVIVNGEKMADKEIEIHQDYAHLRLWSEDDEEGNSGYSIDDLDSTFAYAAVYSAIKNNIILSAGDNVIYNKPIYYSKGHHIHLGNDGRFIFEGVNDSDIIKFACVNENGEEIASMEFCIFFGNGTVRFEKVNPIKKIDFSINEEPCDLDGDVVVGYLYIPENETADVTVTVAKKDATHVIKTVDLVPVFDVTKRAYKYCIVLNESDVNDKDLLNITADVYDGDIWQVVVQKDESIKFMKYGKELYLYAYYDMMYCDDNFMYVDIPDEYGITEGTLTFSADDEILISKSLAECHNEYVYSILGYRYKIEWEDYDFGNIIPSGKLLTFTFTYENGTKVQNRMLVSEYGMTYRILNIQDIADLFTIDVADEVKNPDDVAISFIATDYANPERVERDVGGGKFIVYVDDVEVPDLGYYVENNEDVGNLPLDAMSEVSNRKVSIPLSALNILSEGIHNIRIVHVSGDYRMFLNEETEILNKNITACPFNVDLGLTVEAEDVDFGSEVSVVVKANETFSGDILVQFDGANYTVTITEGIGNITFSNLDAGTYTVKAIYGGDETFALDEASSTFTVNKVNSSVEVSDITFVYGANGTATVVLSGANNFTVAVNDDKAVVSVGGNVITVSGLDVGSYTLSVSTVPDANHNAVTKNATVTVNKADSSVEVSDITFVYGANGTATVVLSGANNFTVAVNDDKAVVSVGGNVITVSGLDVGSYTLSVSTVPDANHNAVTKNATVTVNKADSSVEVSDITFEYGASGKANVVLTGADKFTASVNNEFAVVTINGSMITVSGLNVGSYILSITTVPDANHNAVTKNMTVTVYAKIKTTVKATAVTTTYGTSKKIVVTLTDANGNKLQGKNVIVVLNGAKKTLTTDSKGQVSYTIGTKLAVKKYTATITFSGDNYYLKSTGSAKVTVNKAKATLTAKNKSFKVKKAKKYTITLKTDKKKALSKVKVTIQVKGNKKVKITKKTNSKGKITFDLKMLTKKGEYTATIKFAGNKNYKATSKKVKITVK